MKSFLFFLLTILGINTMAYTANNIVYYQVDNFDCTIADNAVIAFTPSADFVVTGMSVELTSLSGYVSSNGNVTCGNVGPTYNNSGGSVAIGNLTTLNNNIVMSRAVAGQFLTMQAGVPVYVRKDAFAANATTYLTRVTIFGFYN